MCKFIIILLQNISGLQKVCRHIHYFILKFIGPQNPLKKFQDLIPVCQTTTCKKNRSCKVKQMLQADMQEDFLWPLLVASLLTVTYGTAHWKEIHDSIASMKLKC